MMLKFIAVVCLGMYYLSGVESTCVEKRSAPVDKVAVMCKNSRVSGTVVYIDTDLAGITNIPRGTACQCTVQVQGGKQVSVNSFFDGYQNPSNPERCGTVLQYSSESLDYILGTPCYTHNFALNTTVHQDITVSVRKEYAPFKSDYCSKMELKHCSVNQHQCSFSPNLCLPSNWRCNNSPDCPDGTDEADCGTSEPYVAPLITVTCTESPYLVDTTTTTTTTTTTPTTTTTTPKTTTTTPTTTTTRRTTTTTTPTTTTTKRTTTTAKPTTKTTPTTTTTTPTQKPTTPTTTTTTKKATPTPPTTKTTKPTTQTPTPPTTKTTTTTTTQATTTKGPTTTATPTCDPNTEHRCGDGKCIPAEWRCDKTKDCDDNSDEDIDACVVIKCNNRNGFLCQDYKTCVFRQQKCDGIRDCPDGSDESQETCGGESTTQGKGDSEGLNDKETGIIIGVVCGSIFLILVFGCMIFWCRSKKWNKGSEMYLTKNEHKYPKSSSSTDGMPSVYAPAPLYVEPEFIHEHKAPPTHVWHVRNQQVPFGVHHLQPVQTDSGETLYIIRK